MSKRRRVKRLAKEMLRDEAVRRTKRGRMTPALAKAAKAPKRSFVKTGKRRNRTLDAIMRRLRSMND